MGSPGSSRVRGGGRANWARKCWDLSPERHSSGLRREPWELTSVLVASKWWQPKEQPLNCVKTVELNITCTNIIICSVYHHLFPPFSCWMRLKLFLKGLILEVWSFGQEPAGDFWRRNCAAVDTWKAADLGCFIQQVGPPGSSVRCWGVPGFVLTTNSWWRGEGPGLTFFTEILTPKWQKENSLAHQLAVPC